MEREKVVRFNAPKFGEILNGRPKGMSYEQYRIERSHQKNRLKERLKGFLVYKACEVVKVGEKEFLRRYSPCVGKDFVLNIQ